MRTRSRALFHNAYRLEVSAAIAAHEGDFYVRELAEALSIPDQRVRDNVQALESGGLLAEVSPARGRVPRLYRRCTSSYWDLSVKLIAEVSNRDEAT